MAAQQITISLSNDTIQALQGQGYALYVMQKFNTSTVGKALVWQAESAFANEMTIDLDIQYAAYMSNPVVSDTVIVTSTASAPVELGQTATLGENSDVAVTTAGRADAVTLVNGLTQLFTTGLAARAGAGPIPLVSAPLYGLGAAIVAPLDQFLLTFNAQGIAPGMPIDYAVSQSLLVDMSRQATATASYDINTGWSAEGPWAQLVKAGTPLGPLLAHQMPML